MGAWGPRRVVMTEDGFSVKPPFGLGDNDNSLLDVTDLVFIDPVSTGYSRPLQGENKSQFHGVGEDVASVGEFIRLYITRNERWASPKFILGESYGTTRAAGLSGFLQGRTHGMYLNGIVLVSSVLDFQTIMFSPGNSLSYVLFLPHYAATAWFHKKLEAKLQAKALRDVLKEAEDFALNEYSIALLKGNRLGQEEADKVADRLAAYTGLSREYVKQSNMRIRHDRFVKELLRANFETVGRLDSRFKGRDEDAAGETYEFDPASAAIQGAFSTMLNHYVRTELGYKEDLPYAIYGNVYPWNFLSSPEEAEPFPGPSARFGGLNVNVAEVLRRAMSENPFLQVFCANGYYDGATPYFGTEYTFSQIGLNGEFRDRIHMGYYEAGHMMYIHRPSHLKLKSDLAEFMKRAAEK
jgi:carboxypeptidase C (cathepsin A)